MAIASEIRSVGPLRCDGQQKEFHFEFKVFSPEQIMVVWSEDAGDTEAAAPRDAFRVELNKHQDVSPGGVVIFTKAPKSGVVLVIRSNVEYLQPMVLTNHGGFYPEILNDAADRAVVLAQQNRACLDRAVLLPFTSTKKPVDFIKEFFAAHDEALDAMARASKSEQTATKGAEVATGAAEDAKVANEDTHGLLPVLKELRTDTSSLLERAKQQNDRAADLTSKTEALAEDVHRAEASFEKTVAHVDGVATKVNADALLAAEGKDAVERGLVQANGSLSEAKELVHEIRSLHGSSQDLLASVTEKGERAIRDAAQAQASELVAKESAAQAQVDAAKAADARKSLEKAVSDAGTSAAEARQSAGVASDAAARVDADAAAAKAAAEEARRAAHGAVEGQIQADWTETNSKAKSFIFHKPVLGKLAAKDSIAYTELTGTPLLGALAAKDSIAYREITGTPTLGRLAAKDVVSFNELTEKPQLGALAYLDKLSYSSLESTPTLGKLAAKDFVSYTELHGIPEMPTWETIPGRPDSYGATYTGKISWPQVTGAPDFALKTDIPKPPKLGKLAALDAVTPEFIKGFEAIPVGMVAHFYATQPPEGWLLMNGAELSRTKYARLYEAIKGMPGVGKGDGSTTFTLPDLSHRFLEGVTDGSEVGKLVEAGLPNIIGQFSLGRNTYGGLFEPYVDGTTFKITSRNRNYAASLTGDDCCMVEMNLSRYNKTYGRAAIVQPPSLSLIVCIKV